MPLKFIVSLVMLCFSFRIVLILLQWPFRLVSTVFLSAFTGGRMDRAGYWSAMIEPVVFCLLYSGFAAVVSWNYIASWRLENTLLYAGIGFLAALFSLNSYTYRVSLRTSGRVFGSPENRAAVTGAGIGLALGLIAFPFFFHWPQVVREVPGSAYFFAWAGRMAEWLLGYPFVKILVPLAAAVYIVKTGITGLGRGFKLIWSGLKRPFLRA